MPLARPVKTFNSAHALHKMEAETAGNTNWHIAGLAVHTATKYTSRYSIFNRESIKLLYPGKLCDELMIDHPHLLESYSFCFVQGAHPELKIRL